jgi:SAM-dependent methyltransferase
MLDWIRLRLSQKNMRWLYDHIYYSRWICGGRNFFNVGIAPVDAEVSRLPGVRGEEDQAQVYCEVFKAYRSVAVRPVPGNILEIGVGLGGGLPLTRSFFPDSNCFGLDLSHTALQRAKMQRSGGLIAANLLRCPFAPGSFDLIFGVEASPGVDLLELFKELGRSLSPNGILILVETQGMPSAALQVKLRTLAAEAALDMAAYADLTPRLLEARKVEYDRNKRLERWPIPGFRSTVREMSVTPGSKRYGYYANGEWTYFIGAFTHAKPSVEKHRHR